MEKFTVTKNSVISKLVSGIFLLLMNINDNNPWLTVARQVKRLTSAPYWPIWRQVYTASHSHALIIVEWSWCLGRRGLVLRTAQYYYLRIPKQPTRNHSCSGCVIRSPEAEIAACLLSTLVSFYTLLSKVTYSSCTLLWFMSNDI